MMIKPGMFISDRYEIIDKVGSGGMADVYKAKCHRLNRYVAIKILKSEFSSDTSFVQKFRAEAQSVAGLSHPNIVSVYDVGDDNGLHYIVMELVEGITLKRFIERKQRLEVKESVGIAIQIAQGMEAAHTHHIFHRDIKPQNIIISREGKVKVADFGIAKAATSNTISQNAVGSVHYLSPEQARGGYSDERSDIYSLGVTLYEMLTGQVPFAGDNSVSVALLHIQSEATPVQVLNPEVPTSVDRIVQKCMQKKPERRYQSASELIRDLKRSLVNPEGDYVTLTNNAQINNSPTRNMTDEEMSSIKSAAKSPAVHYDNSRPEEQRINRKVRKEAEELDSMDSRLEKILTVVSVIFAVALICVILFLLWQFFFKKDDASKILPDPTPTAMEGVTPTPTTVNKIHPTDTPTPTPTAVITKPLEDMVEMKQVVGYTVDDAIALLKKISPDFTVDWSTEEYSEEYEKGIVSVQYPPAGLLVARDAVIKLTISAGSESVELDDVVGMDSNTAISLLVNKGYKVSPLHEPNNEYAKDTIFMTEPAAHELVALGSEVVVYISDGPGEAEIPGADENEDESVSVPNLIGDSEESAKKKLKNYGLVPGECVYTYSDNIGEGLICNQSYNQGTLVKKGTVINYSISMGRYSEPTPVATTTPTEDSDESDTIGGNGSPVG